MNQSTVARVTTLAQWIHLFNYTDGVFRSPSLLGEAIEHLDLDLRFVEYDSVPLVAGVIYLPRVARLNLRGGDFVQDDESRMDCIAEVLFAISPVEVQWLNAATEPGERLPTFATHLVHPTIVAAGEEWSRRGCLRKLVIQGGFPCPNLVAPTPYTMTPGHTPLPSPGINKTFPLPSISHGASTALPALNTVKPKPINENKLGERAERKRLADYIFKPRFNFAFGSWTVQEIKWRLDGGYTPACIISILSHLFRAIDDTYPSATKHADVDLPSVINLCFLPSQIIDDVRALPYNLSVQEEVLLWICDSVFFTEDGVTSRIWREEPTSSERMMARIKADLIIGQESRILADCIPPLSTAKASASLEGDEAVSSSEDDDEEAKTPEMEYILDVLTKACEKSLKDVEARLPPHVLA